LQGQKKLLLSGSIENTEVGNNLHSRPLASERVVRGYEILAGMQAARRKHFRAWREEDEFDDLPTRNEQENMENDRGGDEKSEDSVSPREHPGSRNSVTLLSLHSTRVLGVSDPRDMLFAHLGLAADGKNFLADYKKTCSQVYEDFAQYLMKTSSSYELLSFVGDSSSRRPKGLSSWAPDWNSPKTTSPLPQLEETITALLMMTKIQR
jgi:hypothetical protein